MAGELGAFGARLATMLGPAAMGRITHKVGMAAKAEAIDAAKADLGSDAAMSNLRGGKAPLRAGFDTSGSQVTIKFTGPWKLAESGRRKSGAIYPKVGGRKGKGVVARRAVMTPQGPRSRSGYGPSRGLNTLTEASKDIEKVAPKAAFAQLQSEIGRVIS